MRRVHICLILLDDLIGGAPMRILKIVRGLPRGRFTPFAVLPEGRGDLGALLERAGAKVFRMPLPRLRYSANPLHALRWAVTLPLTLWRLSRLLRREKADILMAFGLTQITGPLAARCAGVKVLWQITDLVTPFAAVFVFLVRACSDVIGVSSEAVRRKYFRDGVGEKIRVLHSAVNISEFRPTGVRETVRRDLGIPSDALVVGTVGNVNPFKGHEDFVRAAARVKRTLGTRPVRFVIVGQILRTWEGYHERLRSLVHVLGLEDDIVFAGKRLDIARVLEAVDVYVQASLSESFGLSVVEAMAAGKPVVATAVGGVPEIISSQECGILVPARSPDALAEAVLRLTIDLEAARRMAERGLARVAAEFGEERFLERHIALFDEMTK